MATKHTMKDANKKKIADGLSHLLADSYILYLKTQSYHWNVTGPLFQQLHALFETQYTDLAQAIDTIAERIRALGFYAPGSFSQYHSLSKLKEDKSIPKAEAMLKNLIHDQEVLVAAMHDLFPYVSDSGDEATADLLTGRISKHEKNIWMLKSMLG